MFFTQVVYKENRIINKMVKKDPHNHERRYLNWKEKTNEGIPDITKANSDIIKRFLQNMELGLNVSIHSKK